MTDQNNQEPTMEEILASIRRIISEDEAPAEDGAAAPADAPPSAVEAEAPPAPAFPAEPEPEPELEEDVLELTDRIEASPSDPVETVGDLDVFTAPAVEAPSEPSAAPAIETFAPAAPLADDDESLLSAPAAVSAASAFAALSGSIAMPRDGRTLEDVVRELLRPLMKQWLDENLPRIVETAVQKEVERVARRGGA